MYNPAHFAPPDADAMRALLRAHPLATLVFAAADGLEANHVPLILEEEGGRMFLRGHVARANPLWQTAGAGVATLAVFQGPETYVTPSWYASKREHGRVVPTWNYAVVHAHGTLRAVDDGRWLLALLNRLTDRQESSRAQPWKVDDAPGAYVDSMLRAIVGIELAVRRLEGKWKMSQNRDAADRAGVARGLEAEGGEAARAMLPWVRGATAD